MTYLEASKWYWMTQAGMMSFDASALATPTQIKTEPEVIMRATLTCDFQGRLNILKTVEALPLKRVVLNLNHG